MNEVTEIIEIVFERVQPEKVVELLFKVLLKSTLKDFSISTDSGMINLSSKEKILNGINQASNGSYYFNFLNFKLKDILLSRVGFQIYKYDSIYDLNLAIEDLEIRKKISVIGFQKRVDAFAQELKANNYFCGYEPAADEETRLFSGSTLGPLNNWGDLDE